MWVFKPRRGATSCFFLFFLNSLHAAEQSTAHVTDRALHFVPLFLIYFCASGVGGLQLGGGCFSLLWSRVEQDKLVHGSGHGARQQVELQSSGGLDER